jgi:hypothetical protein
MITVAPPRWKRSAIALPAPFVPPVTKTRLPVNSLVSGVDFINVFMLFQAMTRFIMRFALLEKRAIS